MIRSIATLLLIFSFFVRAEAQVSLNTVVQKYNAFKSALPGVRLHFVFSQEKYAPGDTVFFNAYFLKEDLRPVEGRQLIDLSLVAPEGKVLLHYLFTVNNGVGANQIILPEILNPGIYNVAAYSVWMKNIEGAKAFTQELIVVGETTVKKSKTTEDSSPVHVAVASPSDIRITSPAGSLSRYNELYLLVVNESKIIYARPFTQGIRDVVSIDLQEKKFPSPVSALLPGLNIIHVIDKLGRELGTASHYVSERDSSSAKIGIRNANLQTRRRGAVTVTVLDEANRPVEGSFSVKVFNASVLDSAQLSFSRLLALSAPTREPWHQILYGNGNWKQRYNFPTDLSRRGVAYYADGETPLPVQTRLFFYLQENDIMMQTMTLAGGKVRLSIPDVTSNDRLFYMAEREGKEVPGVKIVWEDTTLPVPAPPASTETAEADLYGIFAANKRMIDQAFDFNENDTVDVRIAAVRRGNHLERRLNGADHTTRIDKFVAFATMEEMIHEIIPALTVHKSQGRSWVQVGLQRGVTSSEPLYIIDGVATKDTQYFLSFKPIEIDKVKIVTNPAKLVGIGLMGRSGVVIVETKTGNAVPKHDPSTIVSSINRPMSFPKSLPPNEYRPNFKATIYWNPGIKTDSNGRAIVEFECSDDLGPVYIRVDGMRANGRPFSGEGRLNFVLSEK